MQVDVRMREQEGTDRLRLMGREIVRNDVNLSPLRLTGHDVAEESTKAALVCRGTVWPSTSPDCVLSAAKSDSVPCR